MLLPSPAAYAAGTTRLISWSSILSALSIAPAALCLYLWRNLDLFLLTAILSEFCGLLVLARLLMREFAFTPSTVWLAITMPFVLVGSLAVVAFVLPALDFSDWLAVCSLMLGGRRSSTA